LVSRCVWTQNGTDGQISPGVAVAFESDSGEALATYGVTSNEVEYRTWTAAGGWSARQIGPNLGSTPNSMTLDADPQTDAIMLTVQDAASDLHYIAFNGSSWGTDNELETDTGDTKNQPFLFLWDQGTATPDPSIWLSTEGDDASPDVPGIYAIGRDDAIRFADPDLTLEPGTTDGTFSHVLNLDDFAAGGDANLDALHYVTTAITGGGGADTFDLQPGDLLLSTRDDETLTSNNSLAVLDSETPALRPATPRCCSKASTSAWTAARRTLMPWHWSAAATRHPRWTSTRTTAAAYRRVGSLRRLPRTVRPSPLPTLTPRSPMRTTPLCNRSR